MTGSWGTLESQVTWGLSCDLWSLFRLLSLPLHFPWIIASWNVTWISGVNCKSYSDSPGYTAATNITVQSNYASITMLKKSYSAADLIMLFTVY